MIQWHNDPIHSHFRRLFEYVITATQLGWTLIGHNNVVLYNGTYDDCCVEMAKIMETNEITFSAQDNGIYFWPFKEF